MKNICLRLFFLSGEYLLNRCGILRSYPAWESGEGKLYGSAVMGEKDG